MVIARLRFSKRTGTFASFLQNSFEDQKFLGVRFGKHFSDFRGMLSKNGKNEVFAALCERDDSYSAIVRAFHAANQSFFEQPVHSHTDRAGGKVDFGPNGVDRQRALVEKRLQYAEVGLGNSRLLDSSK